MFRTLRELNRVTTHNKKEGEISPSNQINMYDSGSHKLMGDLRTSSEFINFLSVTAIFYNSLFLAGRLLMLASWDIYENPV